MSYWLSGTSSATGYLTEEGITAYVEIYSPYTPPEDTPYPSLKQIDYGNQTPVNVVVSVVLDSEIEALPEFTLKLIVQGTAERWNLDGSNATTADFHVNPGRSENPHTLAEYYVADGSVAELWEYTALTGGEGELWYITFKPDAFKLMTPDAVRVDTVTIPLYSNGSKELTEAEQAGNAEPKYLAIRPVPLEDIGNALPIYWNNDATQLLLFTASVGADKAYLFKVLFAGGKLQGFGVENNVDLELDGYEPAGITNTGDGYYVVLRKDTGTEYVFANENTQTPINIDTTLIESGSIYLNPNRISPIETINTTITGTYRVLSDDGGGSLTSTSLFIQVSPLYAPYVNFGIPSYVYRISGGTCTATFDCIYAGSNNISGVITQTLTDKLTGRTDITSTYNYSYTGNYDLAHDKLVMSIDGATITRTKENFNINLTAKTELLLTENKTIRYEHNYNNNRSSAGVDKGTDLAPTYVNVMDVSCSGSFIRTTIRQRVYKYRVTIKQNYTEWNWGSVNGLDSYPAVSVILSEQFYTLGEAPSITYSIVSEAFEEQGGSNTRYSLLLSMPYYPIGTDLYYLWGSDGVPKPLGLANRLVYEYGWSQAGLQYATGNVGATGSPGGIVVEIENLGEFEFHHSGLGVTLYDGTSTKSSASETQEGSETNHVTTLVTSYLKSGIDCLMYTSRVGEYTQVHNTLGSYTYDSNGYIEIQLDRTATTTYAMPDTTTTLCIVVKNNIYKITDFKNDLIDAETRYFYSASAADPELTIGEVTFYGYSDIGLEIHARRRPGDEATKIEKTTYNSYSPVFFDNEIEIVERFNTITYNWVGKNVIVHQYVEGKVYKATGVVSNYDINSDVLTVNIEEIVEDSYHFVAEEYARQILITDASDYTMLLYNYIRDFHSHSNLYLVTDAQGNETIELAIASKNIKINDNFIDAIELTGQNVSVRGNNTTATWQAGEPSLSVPTQSLWYKWTAPSNEPITIHTMGSPTSDDNWTDTAIGVYTGDLVDALILIARNEDIAWDWDFSEETGIGPMDGSQAYLSAVRFTPVAETTYYIQVDGYNDTTWEFVLSITTAGWQDVPEPILEVDGVGYADIYWFDTAALAWKRKGAVSSPVSRLDGAAEYISYHPGV